MVNVNEIHELLKTHFSISGHAHIDPESGVVNITGDIYLKDTLHVTQLPVQFGVVTGLFDCSQNKLELLKGAPHHVEGSFWCNHNSLNSLHHAPRHVGYDFMCHHNSELTSLHGAPDHVGGNFYCSQNPLTNLEGSPRTLEGTYVVTYHDQMPLLRLINYQSVTILRAPVQVTIIINKYVGKGKSHILLCSNELKQAGYSGNAAW
jgi:hypothetical protein